jgi:pimeloyl-ACP methyl ester carboxylesterase
MILDRTPSWLVDWFATPGWAEVMDAYYTRQLRRFDFRYESIILDTDYGSTHLLASGRRDAQPLVLLHGRSLNATLWRDYLATFSDRYRVIAIDILGEGGKSAPQHPFTWGDGYARWMTQVFDALKIDQAHLIGMSFGGWLAMKTALHAPERVRALSLLAPAGFVWASAGFVWRGMRAGVSMRLEHARQLVEFCSGKHVSIQDEDAELLHTVFRYHRANAEPPPPFGDPALRKMMVPTQVLMGSHDRVFQPSMVIRRAQRTLPELHDAHILRGIGHGMLSDRPEPVRQRIRAFVDMH